MSKIKAYGDKILLIQTTDVPISAGGIFLPVADRPERLPDSRKPLEAIVHSVGERVTLDLSPGDRVVYNPWAGTAIGDPTDDGYIVIGEDDVVVRLET